MTTTHEIQAFFYTAQDARRAMNALRRTTATVNDPEPLSEPQNGRAWLLTIQVGVGSSSGRPASQVAPIIAYESDLAAIYHGHAQGMYRVRSS